VCMAVGRWRLALLTVTGQALIGSTTNLVKPLFDRTIHGPFLSYPSGHTAGATAFGLVVGLLVADLAHRRRPVAAVTVLGIACGAGVAAAWAQTVLTAHYATDTIGGMSFALALMIPLALILDAVVERLLGMRWALAFQAAETS
jgi:membrane-associated phospholipid phosphatase